MASTVFGDFVFKISAQVRDAIRGLQDWDSQLEDTINNTSDLADSSSQIYDEMASDIAEFDKNFTNTVEEQSETIEKSKDSWIAFGLAASAAVAAAGYSVLKWSPHMQMYSSLFGMHMQRLGIEVGKVLAPLMKLVTDVFGGLVDWFVSLDDNYGTWGKFVQDLIVMGGLTFAGIVTFQIAAKALSWIFDVSPGTGFIDTLKGGAKYLGSIISSVAEAGWSAFTSFIGFLAANPIAAFVIAIAAVVAAIAAIIAMNSDIDETQAAIMEVNTVLQGYIEKLEEIEDINKRVFGEQGSQMVNAMIGRNKELAGTMLEYIDILEQRRDELAKYLTMAQSSAPGTRELANALFGADIPELSQIEAEYNNINDAILGLRDSTRNLVEDTFTFRTEYIGTINDLKQTFAGEDSLYKRLSEALGLTGPPSEMKGTFRQAMTEYARGLSESLNTVAIDYVNELTDDQIKQINNLATEYDILREQFRDGDISFAEFQRRMEQLQDEFSDMDFLKDLVPQEAINQLQEMNQLWRERKISDEDYEEFIKGFMDEYGNGITMLSNNMVSFDQVQLVLIENLKNNEAAQKALGLTIDNTGKNIIDLNANILETGQAAKESSIEMMEARNRMLGTMADVLEGLGLPGMGGVTSAMRQMQKMQTIIYQTKNNNQTINIGTGGSGGVMTDYDKLLEDMQNQEDFSDNPWYNQSAGSYAQN